MEHLRGTEEGRFKKPHLEGGLTMCICVDHQHTSKGPHFSPERKLGKKKKQGFYMACPAPHLEGGRLHLPLKWSHGEGSQIEILLRCTVNGVKIEPIRDGAISADSMSCHPSRNLNKA